MAIVAGTEGLTEIEQLFEEEVEWSEVSPRKSMCLYTN